MSQRCAAELVHSQGINTSEKIAVLPLVATLTVSVFGEGAGTSESLCLSLRARVAGAAISSGSAIPYEIASLRSK